MLRPLEAVDELLFLGEVGSAGQLEESDPVLVGIGQRTNVAVLRRERMTELVDDAVVAHRPALRPPGGTEQMLRQPERGQRLQHRHLDHLAFAGAFAMIECRQNGNAEMEPRRLVRDQARHETRRLAVDAALQRGSPAHALDEIVEGRLVAVGALPRIAQRIGINDRGIDLLQVLVAQPEPFDRGRPAVVDEQVGGLDHALQHRDSLGLLEVETDRALVAVGRHVDRAHALVAAHHATRQAQEIALRWFDLDHVGAHVGQMLCGERPQQHGRQIDHAHARQWSRHLYSHLPSFCSHYGIAREAEACCGP